MNQQSKKTRFAEWYVSFVSKNRWKLFFFILAVLLLSLYPIVTKLKVNPDLATLLPKDTPSVLALNESYERFGSTDRFTIALQASDPYLVAALQDSIKDYISSHWQEDIVTQPQVANDNSFFTRNALLYLPQEHLIRIRDNLEDIQLELGRKHGPLVVDLLGELDAEEKKERIWFDAGLPGELGLPDEASEAFDTFFAAQKEEKVQPTDPKRKLPKELRTRLIGTDRYDSTLFNGVIQCKLTRPSTDINFVEHILARTDTLIRIYQSKNYAVPVKITVEGSYEGLSEVEDLTSGGFVSLVISIILIYLIVAFFFRSPVKAPILLCGQVLLACSVTMCFTALYYGALNPFTVLVASIILGMGIDYSIHFLGNCQRYFTETGDLKKALVLTLEHLLRPMFLAALTTIAGLLSLLIAKFVGFYEFGVISAVGILMSFLTAIFAMPVFITIAGGLPAINRSSFFPKSWNDAKVASVMVRVSIVALIITAVLAVFIPRVEFEHNFQNLRSIKKETRQGIATGVALSSNRKISTPAAVMGSTSAQLDSLYDTLMVRLHTEKDSTLRSFLTLKTFLPSEKDQAERMALIEEIKDLAEARVFDRATGQDSTNIHTLRSLIESVHPFTGDSLPEWALDLLREKDGSYGRIGFIYGSYPSWDALAVADFQDRYGHWEFGGEKLKVFSSQFILSDVIRAVKHDAARMAFVVLIVVILILIFSLRSKRLVLISSGSLLIGFVWSVSILGLMTYFFGIGRIGIYNVVVIPAILGLAIDSTIHLIIAWVQIPDITPRKLIDNIGRLVIASSTTTAAGFAGALGVAHRGLRTIGELSVISILAFLVASIIFTTTFCMIWLKKEKK
ncbi:MAG: MMPL family transporter [Fibrobacter sp.]|jgi:predicted RND superfamily exporter protein|nr:MMPL family transporter [Fibrobacter sp.]